MKKALKTERKKLKQDFVDQLERNGAVGSYYDDMVEDWLLLWDVKNELKTDLKERSTKVEKYDSKGQMQIVNNESGDLLIKTTVQMQKILDFLGLKPPGMQGGDGDNEEEM